jgi:hypothetical protein
MLSRLEGVTETSLGTRMDEGVFVPFYTAGEQLGTIVLEESEHGTVRGGGRDLDLLETIADQVSSIIYAVRRQEEAAQQIDALVSTFRSRERQLRHELERVISGGVDLEKDELPLSELRVLVEDALRHLYDYTYLGMHKLADTHLVSRCLEREVRVVTNLDRGRALSRALVDVIERLHPPDPEPRPLTREWIQYTILHDAYVLGELNRDIMSRLYISESSFNRARRQAVRGVARAFGELERAARAEVVISGE